MSQFANLINSVTDGNNLSLLTSLAEPVKDQIKQSLGGSFANINASPEVAQGVSNIIEQRAPVLSDSLRAVSKTYRWRNIIITGLVLWAIFMVLSRIFIPSEKVQKHIEDTNTLLFGDNGIFLLIGYVWAGALILITVIPAVIALAPRMENVLSSITDVFKSIPTDIIKNLTK